MKPRMFSRITWFGEAGPFGIYVLSSLLIHLIMGGRYAEAAGKDEERSLDALRTSPSICRTANLQTLEEKSKKIEIL